VIKLKTTFFIEGIQDRIRLLCSFEGGDQPPPFIIEGEVGQIADLVEGGEYELLVPSDLHIRVIGNAVVGVKLFHLVEGLVGGHNDLDIPEFLKISQDGFRLVFAMFAIRAEKHNNGTVVLFDVLLRQVGGTIQFEQVEGRDGGKPDKRRLCIGRIGGGLVWPRWLRGQKLATGDGQKGEEWFFHRAKIFDSQQKIVQM
jgi:hypothetical protein